jgi:peptidoglycan hydrolase-like protein with peptidoglycan-binding domain
LKLKADGDFGPATEKALKAWQKANKLPETGIVDEKTFKALKG